MADTVAVMVEYGGLDAAAKDNPKHFYTNDYLPADMPL
jgi:NitT/TauT family transport system substrate-binding protein